MEAPEGSKTERGSEGPGLAILAGVQTDICMERKDLGTSLLLARCSDKELKYSFLVMAYLMLLNYVFRALNLLLIIF
jgi:hypothetical protein